jgi:hypothetical protein
MFTGCNEGDVMDRVAVRISRSTHALLRTLAAEQGVTMAEIVDRAAREYRRSLFWADYKAAYAALRDDPAATSRLRSEIGAWDATLADGL